MSDPVDVKPSWWEWLSDRLNPVLVKEVRQSLRGTYFRRTFFLTLSATLTLGLIMLAGGVSNNNSRLGATFFTTIFVCLVGALFVLVPISAFFSMGAEKEENTFDLLVLSNIKPRQIVMGKLLSAMVLNLLYLSATLPFVVCAFLLPGSDLLVMFYLLVMAWCCSVGLTVVSIAASTITSIKFVRVLVLAGLFGGLMFAFGLMFALAVGLSEWSAQLRDDGVLAASAGMLCFVAAVVAFGIAIASANTAHPEDNRSTPLRCVTLVVGFLVPVIAGIMCLAFGYEEEVIMAFVTMAIIALSVPLVFIATEPDRMTRRVTMSVPSSRLRALLSTIFLPGGARGLLFALFVWWMMIGVGGLVYWLHRLRDPSIRLEGLPAAVVAVLYATIYLAIPTWFLARNNTPRRRLIFRGFIFFLPAITTMAPVFFDLFTGGRGWNESHLGNPLWLISEGYSRRSSRLSWGYSSEDDLAAEVAIVVGIFFIALLMNARRILSSIQEVMRASAARRSREAAARALVTDEVADVNEEKAPSEGESSGV